MPDSLPHGATLADEDVVRRVAHIVGESSAAAKAVGELDTRRKAQEDVAIYKLGAVYLVGPRVTAAPAERI